MNTGAISRESHVADRLLAYPMLAALVGLDPDAALRFADAQLFLAYATAVSPLPDDDVLPAVWQQVRDYVVLAYCAGDNTILTPSHVVHLPAHVVPRQQPFVRLVVTDVSSLLRGSMEPQRQDVKHIAMNVRAVAAQMHPFVSPLEAVNELRVHQEVTRRISSPEGQLERLFSISCLVLERGLPDREASRQEFIRLMSTAESVEDAIEQAIAFMGELFGGHSLKGIVMFPIIANIISTLFEVWPKWPNTIEP